MILQPLVGTRYLVTLDRGEEKDESDYALLWWTEKGWNDGSGDNEQDYKVTHFSMLPVGPWLQPTGYWFTVPTAEPKEPQ